MRIQGQRLYNATAIILAGGLSTRLGFDKQLIRVGDHYLIDHLIEVLTDLFCEVILVSNVPELHRNRQVKVVSDHYDGVGPLAGLHAGLEASSYPMSYVIACDMPWILPAYIHYLMKRHSNNPEKEIWITRLGAMFEPLGGLYSRSLVNRISGLIESGNRRIQSIFTLANMGYISEKIARIYSPDWRMFYNINTEADLEQLERAYKEEETCVQDSRDQAL